MADLKVALRFDVKDGQGTAVVKNLDKALGGVAKAEDRVAAATRRANRNMGRQISLTKQVANSFADAHKKALSYGTGIASFAGAYRAFNSILQATIRQEQALAQVEARIRATGGAAGYTTDELADMAAAFQNVTTFGDEEILETQAILLSFTGIGRDAFGDTTRAVLDLSVAMKQDLRTSAIAIGKAMNDPARGLDALSRSGTQFTDEQKKMVKALVAVGNTAGAQRLILDELDRQYKDAAKAARDTLGGALAGLSNAWGDLLEVSKKSQGGLVGGINALEDAIKKIDIDELHQSLAAVGQIALYVGGALAGKAALGLAYWVVKASIATVKAQLLAIAASGVAAKTDVARARMVTGAAAARKYGTALHVTSTAARGLSRSLALLGGPVGIAALVAYGIYEVATASDAAADSLGAIDDAGISTADTLQELIDKTKELSAAQRKALEIELRHKLLAARDEADNLQGDYDDLLGERKRYEDALENAGSVGGSKYNPLPVFQPPSDEELEEAKNALDLADEQVTKLEGLQKRVQNANQHNEGLAGSPEKGKAEVGQGGQAERVVSDDAQKLADQLGRDAERRQLETLDGVNAFYDKRRKLLVDAYGKDSAAVVELEKQREEKVQAIRDKAEAEKRQAEAKKQQAAREIEQTRLDNLNPLDRLKAQHDEELDQLRDHLKTVEYDYETHGDIIKETQARQTRERLQLIQDIEDEDRQRKLELDEERERQRQEIIELGATADQAALHQKSRDAGNTYKDLKKIKRKEDETDAQFEDRKRNLRTKTAQHTIGVAKQTFLALGAHSKEAFEAYKAFAIAEALISTYQGAISAYKAMSGIPVVGPALGVAAAAAIGVFGAAQVNQIRAQQPPNKGFRQGGIIEGRQDFGYAAEQRVGHLGEAGPEAILPLNRGPGGVLGVRVVGGLPGAGKQETLVLNPQSSITVNLNGPATAADGEVIGDAIERRMAEISQNLINQMLRPGGRLHRETGYARA